MDLGEINAVIARCRDAQRRWADLSVRERLRPLRGLRHLLAQRAADLCAAVRADVGKSAEETVGTELLPLADACRFLELDADRLLKPRCVSVWRRPVWMRGQLDRVYRRPRGVVGIIGTWNYPLLLNGVQIIQALTAGNGVVWKPSECAPHSATALASLLHDAGYSPELFQPLAPARDLGPLLAEADVDHVAFTGSDVTGQKLAARLGERLVSSTLELSGCDAMFVLADADINLAARCAWFGLTLNRGQTCLAVRRVFVDEHVLTPFLDALRPLAAAAVPLGLILPGQVGQFRRLVGDAVSRGARLLAEPPPCPADHVAPTVIVDARPEMAVCVEAPFSPLAAVVSFRTLDEAVGADARCPFALGASIFGRDLGAIERLAARLRAGSVTVNEVIVPTAHPAVPIGGRGRSGWGVTQGAEGLLDMTVPQAMSVCRSGVRPHLDTPAGFGPGHAGLLTGTLDFSHGGTLSRRLRGLWALVGALVERLK